MASVEESQKSSEAELQISTNVAVIVTVAASASAAAAAAAAVARAAVVGAQEVIAASMTTEKTALIQLRCKGSSGRRWSSRRVP